MNLGKYAKSYVAAIGLGITVASVIYGPANHWVVIAVAVASAIGVYAVPNVSQADASLPGKNAAKIGKNAGENKTIHL